MTTPKYDIATRAQALSLHSEGCSRAYIVKKTGYTPGGLTGLIARAKKRGYTPGKGPIRAEYVEDAPRSGRPPTKKESIIKALEADPTLRGASTQTIADRINKQSPSDAHVSRRTVLKALRSGGLKSAK
ncbi:hypothetical protein F5Y12DRAFT_619145 [Xylaria sp. FL1777]|nr:hypothetical protein F5Y12DRAFT_619145 [Xylaria sp. FL1777]